jgi:type VI secretion system protein ImpM
MPEAPVNAPGWFGKLPSRGDFVSRRLPDAFILGWDDWLQRSLASAREQLGEGWLDCYLVAPIRRFWLAPGLLGGDGWVGVLMPSVDRVGRHFPLTIALAIGNSRADSLATALAAGAWFRAVDAVARQVLDIDFSVDDLERQLAALAPLTDAACWALALPACGSVWWCDDASEHASGFRCFGALPPAEAFVELLEP